MTQNPKTRAQPPEDVKIRTARGLIAVTAPGLFDCDDDRALHTLIERVFRSSAVETVSVDRENAALAIRFDHKALSAGAALQTFSAALTSTSPAADPRAAHVGSLLRPYLERIPGRVRRVERRRDPDGTLTTATLGGTRSAVDALGLIPSPAAHAADRIVTLLPSQVSTESTVVVDVLIIEFDPSPQVSPGRDSEAGPLPAGADRLSSLHEVVVSGGRRIVNLAAAGGCFVMSIVGVVTPGIPTVPFVLATGYFLARSSPSLHNRFKNSPFFGQMVRDYEDRGGIRRSTKV